MPEDENEPSEPGESSAEADEALRKQKEEEERQEVVSALIPFAVFCNYSTVFSRPFFKSSLKKQRSGMHGRRIFEASTPMSGRDLTSRTFTSWIRRSKRTPHLLGSWLVLKVLNK